MYVDPNGHFLISLLVSFGIGAVLGGIYGGVSAAANGQNVLAGIFSGALVGGVLGLSTFLGGSTMLLIAGKSVAGFTLTLSATEKLLLLTTTFVGSMAISMGAGMGGYALQRILNNEQINISEMVLEGINTSLRSGLNFFTGMILSASGGFNHLVESTSLSFLDKVFLGLERSSISFVLFPWKSFLKRGK